VASDGATTLDLLITVRSPKQSTARKKRRPPLNLALVIDRSGSMAGRKLSDARKASRFLAGELTARDRLAIVAFDDEVQVLMPSTPVADPQPFIEAINTIHSGRCTALFDGWLSGAMQVAQHLDPTQLNRVLLLSDGQANQGLTDHPEIAAKVAGLCKRGISTSAFGLGDRFDEDLMGSIASSGDGTLAFIESPSQLAELYACELQELAGTLGTRVSLGFSGQNGAELLDLLNDLEPTESGNFRLPNLRAGQELNVGLRLQMPAWAPNQEIASVLLSWDSPAPSGRQMLNKVLTLPVITAAELAGLDADPAVAEQLAVLEANRLRRRAIEQLDRGDITGAELSLNGVSILLSALPDSKLTSRELQLLEEEQAMLRQDRNLSRKRLSRQSLRSSNHVWEVSDVQN
jgi:Ca-activated chloride channel family protein